MKQLSTVSLALKLETMMGIGIKKYLQEVEIVIVATQWLSNLEVSAKIILDKHKSWILMKSKKKPFYSTLGIFLTGYLSF